MFSMYQMSFSTLSGIGFAVPMEISLYICLESALMITPFISFANSRAREDLPLAVQPVNTSICFFSLEKFVLEFFPIFLFEEYWEEEIVAPSG